MYRVDVDNKKLIEIPATSYSGLDMKERFDIQEWIAGTPEILGESLLIIAKELVLPSGRGSTCSLWMRRDHWSSSS